MESAAALERITARLRSKGFHRVEAVLASEFQTHNGGRSTYCGYRVRAKAKVRVRARAVGRCAYYPGALGH